MRSLLLLFSDLCLKGGDSPLNIELGVLNGGRILFRALPNDLDFCNLGVQN